MQSHRRGIFFALAAASIYGLVPNIARLAFEQGIPALESVVARTIIVVVVLGVFAALTRQSFTIPSAARHGLLLQVIAAASLNADGRITAADMQIIFERVPPQTFIGQLAPLLIDDCLKANFITSQNQVFQSLVGF